MVVAAFVGEGLSSQYGNSSGSNGIEWIETLKSCRLAFRQTGSDDAVFGQGQRCQMTGYLVPFRMA